MADAYIDVDNQKTVLVVEDDNNLRGAISDILKRKNVDHLEAKNGREAVEIALAKHPSVILLDLLMPEMDGMTALKKIREDDWGSKVPVVILTNLSPSSKEVLSDLANNKPEKYLVKSDWKIHDVIDHVEKLLNQ